MQEKELLERKDLREKAISRVEVLEKVKRLFLIPQLGIMTLRQVAEYYEVPDETAKTCYYENRSEIDEDGALFTPYKDFSKLGFQTLKTEKGKATYRIDENTIIVVPTRGILCFPQRAILRIGMLLRDSKIAKEVRTQLLNTFEQSFSEQKVKSIEIEEGLQKELLQAVMDGDLEAESQAKTKIIAFQNRHIHDLTSKNAELQENNKALAGEILKWEDREQLNKAIRSVASIRQVPFGYIWKELYDELRYKHHIGLSQRGEPPYIRYIRENEWPLVQQSLSAICENSGISISKIMKKAKMI